jgi:hypothetical protein
LPVFTRLEREYEIAMRRAGAATLRRMRWLLLVIAIAACGPAKSKGPAWPAASTTAEDGGESIAPRPSATYAAAVERSADVEEDKPAETTSATAAPASEDKPATTPTMSQPTSAEDVFQAEEIIIEVED